MKLFCYQKCWGINASPFCLKTELYLKNLGFTFEIIEGIQNANPPKGKLPYIDDGGTIISDSDFIIDYISTKYKKNLLGHLSESEQAISWAFKKMVEEHLYWIALYARWFDEANSKAVMQEYFGDLPNEVIEQISAKTKRDFIGTGIGLHSQDEVYNLGLKDLKSIESYLASQDTKLFFGDIPSEIDIVMCAFFINIIDAPINSPLKSYVTASLTLSRYLRNLKCSIIL